MRLILFKETVKRSLDCSAETLDRLQTLDIPLIIFTGREQCFRFIRKESAQRQTWFIVTDHLAPSTICAVHGIDHIDAIFLLGEDHKQSRLCSKRWQKVKGICATLDSICDLIEKRVSTSSPSATERRPSVNHLDTSFMYTELLKRIFSEMDDDAQAWKDLIAFVRSHYHGTNSTSHGSTWSFLDQFEQGYGADTAIYWYTRDCSLHEMVNHALRTQNINHLVQMRLFIRDLLRQIDRYYAPPTETLRLFRGQLLSCLDLERVCRRGGCLYSFNCFLSTTTEQSVAQSRAESCASQASTTQVGILFVIDVQPQSCGSISFVLVNGHGAYANRESEVLFCPHTRFRVGTIEQWGQRLWVVHLTLTNEDDEEMRGSIELVWKNIAESRGWEQMWHVLIHRGHFHQAERVIAMFSEDSIDDDRSHQSARAHHCRGLVEKRQGNAHAAMTHFLNALRIYERSYDENHLSIATLHNDLGQVYEQLGQNNDALLSFDSALTIQENSIVANGSALEFTLTLIGQLAGRMKLHFKAVDTYLKLLVMAQRNGSSCARKFSSIYARLIDIYSELGQREETVKFVEKLLDVQADCLHEKDPLGVDLAVNIGQWLTSVQMYPEALEHYLKAARDLQRFHRRNVEQLARVYHSIGHIYLQLADLSNALEFLEKTYSILARHRAMTFPSLPAVLDHIGQIYQRMGNEERAVTSFRHAIALIEKSSSIDQCELHSYREHLRESLCRHSPQ